MDTPWEKRPIIYGPNDGGYMVDKIRKAAELIVRATDLYCEGHYAHSNARDIPQDHPFVRALEQLALFDKENAQYANHDHDPKLFEPHRPTEEAKNRWSYSSVGPEGKNANSSPPIG